MKPLIYYGNLWAQHTLSGTNTASDPRGAVRRVADADLSNPYQLVDGDPETIEGIVSGQVQMTTQGLSPTGFAMVRMSQCSGFIARLISEDVGGGNQTVHDERTLVSDDPYHVALDPPDGTGEVWRFEMVGTTSGIGIPLIHEMLLGTLYEVDAPQIGVQRRRQRQSNRLPIPGGQPFWMRFNGQLRCNAYNFVFAEDDGVADSFAVEGALAFVEGVEDGGPFFHVDDRGEEYWAELLGESIDFDDQAGVWSVNFVICEVRR
jgi:hypothetical protein